MQQVKYAAVLAALVLAAPAFAQSFVGEWVATAKTAQGDFSEKLIVTKTAEGYAIAVEPISELPAGTPAAGPGVDVALEGDKFSYKRVVTFPGGSLEVFYDGVVAGNSFTGQVEIDGLPTPMPYQGVRAKGE
jgi:hypothetical protein